MRYTYTVIHRIIVYIFSNWYCYDNNFELEKLIMMVAYYET